MQTFARKVSELRGGRTPTSITRGISRAIGSIREYKRLITQKLKANCEFRLS